jgi:catechol 2,3-dioxygenase-like lactoylglutathione lyase family enzyme
MQENLRFINPVVFVKDIALSKRFYRDVLGLKIISDAGVFVLFENHFSIHQAKELEVSVFGEAAESSGNLQGKRNLLLYFESDTLQETFKRIGDDVELIHPIVKQSWGQSVFRFYDPDGHIVEIGEPL